MIGVRPHFFVAGALLLLAALLGVATALRVPGLAPDLYVLALLGGLTLLAQAIAYWYVPSFTKRSVILDGMATYAGPILFPAAVLGAILRTQTVRGPALLLGLGLFSVVALGSALFGPPWRSGIPFWRTPGPHQQGDRLAAITLATAFLWIAGAGLCAMYAPPLLAIAWPLGLAFFALGALAHLVPRGRARPMIASLYAASLLLAQAGAIVALLARAGVAGPWTRAGYALLAGFALAALALAPPGPGKRAGPRMREAAPLLLASVGLLLVAIIAAAMSPELTLARAVTAYLALLAAVALAMGAAALLALPVVFNQRPDARFILPTLLAVIGAATLLAARLLIAFPRWPAAALLAAALVLYVAVLAPLRAPRRAC